MGPMARWKEALDRRRGDAGRSAGDCRENAEARAASVSLRQIIAPALWIVVLALSLSWSTYAWFSSSPYTNVTPVAYTVSETGTDLLISSSESGPWAEECELASASKTLYPVSTSDLATFWGGVAQDANGVTYAYADVTSAASDYILEGTVYLKGGGTAMSVHLLPDQMSVSSDPQLLAALRLGFVLEGSSGTQAHIFRLDELGSTAGATSRTTTARTGAVVSGGSLVDDPASDLSAFASGGEALCTISGEEVVQVRYFVYMEGCDENCVDEAQSSAIQLRLAFEGVKA